MDKCPVCSGELEEVAHSDSMVFFKCKNCKAKILITDSGEKCDHCGEKIHMIISTSEGSVTVCAHCGNKLSYYDPTTYKKKNNDFYDETLASIFLFFITLVLLVGYFVITYFFWDCFNLIIFIILLIITICTCILVVNFSNKFSENSKIL